MFNLKAARTVAGSVPLLAVVILLFWKVILLGNVVSGDDVIFAWYPWLAGQYAVPSNPVISDGTTVFRPWAEFASQSLKLGHLPLWNPMIGSGAPFVGNTISALFYPLTFFNYVLEVSLARTLLAVLNLLLPGIFMYIWMVERKTGEFPALVSSLAFMLSGAIILWITFPTALIWVPLAFYFTDKLVQRPSLFPVFGLASVTSLELLSGQPERSIIAVFAGVSYLLFALGFPSANGLSIQSRRKATLAACLALALGLAAASVQILPSLDYLFQSEIWASRTAYSKSAVTPLLPAYFVTAVLPDFFGNPLGGVRNWVGPLNYNVLNSVFVGPVVFFLAAYAVAFSRRRMRYFFGGLALFSFLFAYVRGFSQFIPVLNLITPVLMSMLFSLSFSVLAGFGAEKLSEESPSRSRRASVKSLIALALSLAMSFALLSPSITAFCTPSLCICQCTQDLSLVAHLLEEVLAAAVLIGVVTAVMALHRMGKISHRSFMALILLSVLVSMISFGSDYNPQIDRNRVYPVPSTPAIDFLLGDKDVFRILGLGPTTLPANTAMYFGLNDVRIYDGFTPRYYGDLLRAATDWAGKGTPITRVKSLSLIRLLNVKYVMTPPDEHFGMDELVAKGEVKQVYAAADARIFLVEQFLPRAFVVHQVVAAKNSAESLRATVSPLFDPRTTVVLSDGTMPEDAAEWANASTFRAANVVVHEPDSVLVKVDVVSDGCLVLADNYISGWTAYVDGIGVPILRADHSFRAVFVQAGPHVVSFFYRPISLEIGSYISLLALLVMAAAVGYERYSVRTKSACEIGEHI